MKTTVLIATLFLAASAWAATPPVGTWEWVSTEESPGVLITPDDLGYTVQREFLVDGIYHEYRNEVLYRSGEYWVEDVEFMDMVIPALRISCYPGPVETSAFYFGPTVLELWWGADPGGWPYLPQELLASREPVSTEGVSWGIIKSLYR
jgi:hypothetical protein|nr:hypothetical protein [Candidatus Krumholzibacteria bacterium]